MCTARLSNTHQFTFLWLNFRRYLFDQFISAPFSLCRTWLSFVVLMILQSLVSSANMIMLLIIQSGKSFTNNRNSSGPNTEPCCTPLSTSIRSEKLPFITVARDNGRLLYFGRVIFLFFFIFLFLFYFFSVHQFFDVPGPIFAKLCHTMRYVLK